MTWQKVDACLNGYVHTHPLIHEQDSHDPLAHDASVQTCIVFYCYSCSHGQLPIRFVAIVDMAANMTNPFDKRARS